MIAHALKDPAPPMRRPARDIIDAVVDNMRKNLEPLKYSTLAASRYTVYLHPKEYARLEGVIPILREQTVRALAEELDQLNRRSRAQRMVLRWTGRGEPDVQNAGAEWQVDFVADSDGDVNEGDVLVDSELLLPAPPDLGVGGRTRHLTTVHAGSPTAATEYTGKSACVAPVAVRARIAYDDDGGNHLYEVMKASVTVGRGGTAYPVDIRIASSPDVSREHARIRHDAASGRFFLIDLSSLGTTLNGRHVPCGFDEVNGTKRENGAETPIPDGAKIGLAGTVFLEFRAAG